MRLGRLQDAVNARVSTLAVHMLDGGRHEYAMSSGIGKIRKAGMKVQNGSTAREIDLNRY